MPASQVSALYGAPHEVAVHTLTHPDLTQLPENEMVREILEDRKNLEKQFGTLIRGAAYPYGAYNAAACEALKNCGIEYCRTVNSTHRFQLPDNWLTLHPTCHHNAGNLNQLCDRFLNDSAPFGSLLFYLWGHSYEFESADNWHVIEHFCERMGGHEDIWYATNIEIVDYVNACRSIRTSANGKRLHNPTCIDVWADIDGKRVCIKAGDTVEV